MSSSVCVEGTAVPLRLRRHRIPGKSLQAVGCRVVLWCHWPRLPGRRSLVFLSVALRQAPGLWLCGSPYVGGRSVLLFCGVFGFWFFWFFFQKMQMFPVPVRGVFHVVNLINVFHPLCFHLVESSPRSAWRSDQPCTLLPFSLQLVRIFRRLPGPLAQPGPRRLSVLCPRPPGPACGAPAAFATPTFVFASGARLSCPPIHRPHWRLSVRFLDTCPRSALPQKGVLYRP